MNKIRIEQTQAGQYLIKGDLDRDTVPLLSLKNYQQLSQGAINNKIVIELSEVEHTDTAGLAWLVNLLKDLKQKNTKWQLINIPETLVNLAKISDVDSFLSVQ